MTDAELRIIEFLITSDATRPADLPDWLLRTPSPHTRRAYRLDLDQFLAASGIQPDAGEDLAAVRPKHVAAWRGQLSSVGQTNSTIRRKSSVNSGRIAGIPASRVFGKLGLSISGNWA
jgi:hypothetical protein